ncbi:hypothetical protein [Cupriavidus sp. D39]|uniref:hypothetical protein n=1 Tax=Cupriavidus sp. D39 TaxID=2997877 RepID=UPI002271FE5A|nr:hypothetical protein [Cupriavidus sp. D39]MCY0855031.1 hypothetical protein [Cupriavidus sp. D39]
MRTQFSTDLERTREQVAVAQERAGATERRALREIDQERTLRQRASRRSRTCALSSRRCRRGRKTPPWPPRRRGRG